MALGGAAAMIDFLGSSSKGHFQASYFSGTAGKALLASTDSARDATLSSVAKGDSADAMQEAVKQESVSQMINRYVILQLGMRRR